MAESEYRPNYSSWAITAVKSVAVVALMSASIGWLSIFIPWGLNRSRGDLGLLTWLYAGLNLLGAMGFSVAVSLVSKTNLIRVVTSVCIIFTGLFVGMYFGDPMNRGSYDHLGGRERLEGYLSCGSLGAILGYLVTLMREALHDDGGPTMDR